LGVFEHSLKSYDRSLQPQARVLAIGGSPRRGGNSDVLLRQIISGVDKYQLDSAILQLRDVQYQGCIGCERCRKDKICTGLQDGMSFIYKDILACQGLVLVCPTHNYNVTAWMKAFIDRLYCFYNFANSRPRQWSSALAGQGRKAVIAAICEQENVEDMGFTLEAMRLPLEALGYEVVGQLPVFRIFEKAKVKEDIESLEKAKNLGSILAVSLLPDSSELEASNL
jgi:multimeric flavodoxin WrbA